MKRQPATCWPLWRRPAFTLVEVVASLMLLGTLLVGILAAHRRHAEQVERAQARLTAVTAADRILTEWREQGIWGASASSGPIVGSNLLWRWSVRSAPELRRVGAQVGRLEIFDSQHSADSPLASIELLVTSSKAIPPAYTAP